MTDYTEDHLVEQPVINLLRDELGWEHVNALRETFGEGGTLGRSGKHEVVLASRLRASLCRLNPAVPEVGIEQAVDEMTRDRSAMSLIEANREIYDLIKNGAIHITSQPEESLKNIYTKLGIASDPRGVKKLIL